MFPECALSLGLPTANITWSDFPRGVKKCHVTFPSPEGDRRGVVIELTRLNVPCQDGGNIYFSVNSSIKHYHNYKRLCGKLEEIPLTGRTIYFPSTLTSTTSFNFQGSPVFAFIYHLVDYCYNVTLTSSNDTLTLRPHQGLHCTFRIHLPYGNRVSVQLQVGEDPPLETEYPFPPINNNHTSPVVRNVEETPCDGLITRLWDGASSWSECTRENDIHRNVRVVSRGNVIFLLVSGVYGQTVRLWYHALSVSEVIGRCPYGWVAALEMCITVVEEIKLPWLEAEEECNRRGGHLASITSQDTQDLIDILITNREVGGTVRQATAVNHAGNKDRLVTVVNRLGSRKEGSIDLGAIHWCGPEFCIPVLAGLPRSDYETVFRCMTISPLNIPIEEIPVVRGSISML
uniref:C-type lectin domain-containing protein n=1 Tax=Timema monikensis TaxID=170555 RepID=A0A7R9ELE9_9NEOP|nr:unnamed protein product [Timema monikensis]